MLEHQIETQSRLLAKILRELLASEPFESLSDLTDALKARCGRLKIKCSPDDIGNAFRLIASNRELLALTAPTDALLESAPDRDVQPIEAKRIYADIMARYRAEQPAPRLEQRPARPADFPDLVVVS